MSNQYGPRIVTNGLVLCLDAANTKSYPGSGSTWSDLSSFGANCSLVNGPIYTSSDGSFSFDGIEEYGSITNAQTRTDIMTNEVWFRPSSVVGENGRSTLIRTVPSNTLSDMICILQNSGTNLAKIVIEMKNSNDIGYTGYESAANIVTINRWYHMVHTINRPSGNTRVFLNTTSVINSSTSTHSMTFSANIQIAQQGTNTANAFARRFTGKIGSVRIYNRVLSTAEVLQNYNATKGRFGL
jgi:hypothetical protein